MRILFRSSGLPLVACVLALFFVGCSREAKLQRHFNKAETFFAEGSYGKALIEYQNVLRYDRTNLTAIVKLGTIFLEQGSPLRAVSLWMPAPRKVSTNKTAQVLLADVLPQVRGKLAQALIELGDLEGGYQMVQFALAQNPADAEALRQLVRMEFASQDVNLAKQKVEAFAKAKGDAANYHYALGALAMYKRNGAEVEAEVKASLEADPKFYLAYDLLGSHLVGQSNLVEAEKALQAAADLAPVRSRTTLRLIEFQLLSGKVEEAQKKLNEVTSKAPDYVLAWFDKAQVDLAQKKTNEAFAALDRILFSDALNDKALRFRGELYLSMGQLEKGIKDLEQAYRFFGHREDLRTELARAYLANRNAPRAFELVNTVTNYTDGLLLKARLLMTRTNYFDNSVTESEAETILRRVLRNNEAKLAKMPSDWLNATNPMPMAARLMKEKWQSQLYLMELLGRRNQMAEAEKLCQQLMREDAKNPIHYVNQAMIEFSRTNLPAGRVAFEKAYDLSENFRFLEQVVELDLRLKETARAVSRVESEMKKTPDAAYPFYLLGRIYASNTNTLTKAEEALRTAIKKDEQFVPAYYKLAEVYRLMGKSDKAIGELKDALDKAPRDLNARMMLAVIYRERKEYAAARKQYEAITTYYPEYWMPFNELAYLCVESLHDLDAAYTYARKASELARSMPRKTRNPYQPIYYTADTLGWVLFRRGDYQQALGNLYEAVEINRQSAEAQYHLGMTFFMLGRTEEAKAAIQYAVSSPEDFSGKEDARQRLVALQQGGTKTSVESTAALEKMVADNPKDLVALSRLGEIYLQQVQNQKAADTFLQILKVNNEFFAANLHLAELYAGPLQNPARAMDYARKAREISPDNAQAAYVLGLLAFQTGDYPWAFSLLQQCMRDQAVAQKATYYYAWAAYTQGRLIEARQAMQKAQAVPAWASVGKVFLEMLDVCEKPQMLAGAEAQIKELLKTDATYVPAMMAMGMLQSQRGQNAEAMQNFEAVLKKYGQFMPAKRMLALLYSNDSEREKNAYEYALAVREVFPNDPALAKALGKLNHNRKDYRAAIRFCQEALRAYPTDAEALYFLGHSHALLKEKIPAKEALQKSLAAGLKEPLAAEARKVMDRKGEQ